MNEQTYTSTVPLEEREGYCSILKFILLSIVTLGIYTYIWFYRTTAYLNRYKGEPAQDAALQTVLCIFVPYYLIYWTYTNARRVDGYAKERGVPSDLSTICLVLSIFFALAAYVLMQDKLNNLIAAEDGAAAPAARAAGDDDLWQCPQCATLCRDRFCTRCGGERPSGDGVWICGACHSVCRDRFCTACGAERPADGWACPDCGARCTAKVCTSCGKARV